MENFSTERMTAEKLRQDHADDLTTLHLDADVSRFLGGVRSPEQTRSYLDQNIAHWDRYGFGLWVLRLKTGEFAGRAGIRHLVLEGAAEIEIAYTFKKSVWGQGLASEIAGELTELGFTRLALPSLVGIVELEHLASRRVLEKLDYALERHAIQNQRQVALYRRLAARAPQAA